MINVNINAFSNLIDDYLKYNDGSVKSGKRYIKSRDFEKDWIKEAQIRDILIITSDIRLIEIEFCSEFYIAIVGANITDNQIPEILETFDINSGITTLLVSEKYLKLSKRANQLEFYDNILFQHLDPSYNGHDFEDILQFLEPVQIFKLSKFSILKTNSVDRIACYIFSKSTNELILEFNQDVLDLISELSLMGSDSINYRLIINCIFSTTYKHSFLELYRLIERIFPVSYLKELHLKSRTTLDFLDFVSEFETSLKWKPKEDMAIDRIFEESKVTTLQYFQNFKTSLPDDQNHNHATFFYKLRNSIVHFRANHEEIFLTSEQWNLLLLATLYLIDEHYSLYNNILQ
ncbi:hypothetical protein [Chryseobacterium arthrosphaerae]|uniref:Apea-like HEPN domain-containing protein n=1 Tax=Chryseobacterium arthrosphaerae TaxID=651561 RepID=A0A1B8ZV21_9FLAO|nr:hypothetical protein [Chryseobacterium arthrosphaerae]OCA75440.1 hypothetical protein BBI00_14390 [Chryseobacterium arthrosphaerae]